MHVSHVVEYEDPVTLAVDLKRLRLDQRLPRHVRVVVWPDAGDPGVTPADSPVAPGGFRPDTWRLRDRLRPIVKAGFRITAVLTPSDAVAALSAVAAPAIVAAGCAIGRDAGSIAVARDGDVLFSRELWWKFAPPEPGAPLVERYAFAAQIAPQLAHAMALTHERHNARVERIVLCGSASDLRSLASPLIEELDVEVEALDGSAAFASAPDDPDAASMAQLAAAAAIARPGTGVLPDLGSDRMVTPGRILVGTAAAAVVILLVLLFWPARQVSKPASAGRDRFERAQVL